MATEKLVLLLVALISVNTVPTGIEGHSLIQSVKAVADEVNLQQPQQPTQASSGSNTSDPIPGKMNVCEDLCPKWCQKVDGTERVFTNCHYLCGNLCNQKMRQTNPFIGNSRYEVVPSEFDFARYDLNEDKLISVPEFARTEGIRLIEALDFFTFADSNNDGFIDTAEFQAGPMVFTVQMAAELSQIAMTAGSSTPSTTV